MINYQNILNKNMLGVFKDVLKNIRDNGLSDSNHLYITFLTNHKEVILPEWIIKNYPKEMTIVVQYEYYDIVINKNNFSITLSFNNIRTKIIIGYNAIVSFADPSANFGLILKNKNNNESINKNLKKISKKNNVIKFSKYKKNYQNK
tara:strand:+ start:654 stop:1094 length:441 start_codon:yes stop_codon:yes gene_type:complete